MGMTCVAVLLTISGRIKSMRRGTIIAKSDNGSTYSIETNANTRFTNCNGRSRAKGPRTGNRVEVDVERADDYTTLALVERTEYDVVAVEVHYNCPDPHRVQIRE